MAKDESLHVAFTKEELLKDLRGLMGRLVAMTLWGAGPEKALLLLGSSEAAPRMQEDLYDPGNYASDGLSNDLGLDIGTWPITEVFDHLYDFAVHAIARFPLSELSDETQSSICCALVYDLVRSDTAQEFGIASAPGAMCMQVVRLANARAVLEGGSRLLITSSMEETYDDLTIRDVALLAGMEEASVRNAANPKLANPLLTKKIDGNTYIEPATAKAWLKSRGRYVSIQVQPDAARVDLAKTGFRTALEAWSFLVSRAEMLGRSLDDVSSAAGTDTLSEKNFGSADALPFDDSQVGRLAEMLQLDRTLLRLRLEQVRLAEMSKRVQQEIHKAASTQRVKG